MLPINYWPQSNLYWPADYWTDLVLSRLFGTVSGTAIVTAILVGNGYLSGSSQGTAIGYLTVPDFGPGQTQGDVPMLSAGIWRKNQPNTILFVLTDAAGSEVTGLGSTFTLQISKAGGTFAVGIGTKSEVALGWYKYVSVASEANTSGPVALAVTHASVIQQNLEYTVEDRVVTAVEFTYTLTNTVGGVPIAGADINFSVNSDPANTVWSGVTDAFGVARDFNGNLPRLSPGSYYVFSYKPGFVFANPDTEVVS